MGAATYHELCHILMTSQVMDLVGNVWQMTSGFEDMHTRSVVLKGGSNYRPNVSQPPFKNWYFPQTRDNLMQYGARTP
jgi:hypothetical protein